MIIVVLLGDTGVGKTNIVKRFVTKGLPKTNQPTIGVEFSSKIVQIENNVRIKAQIWDTGTSRKQIIKLLAGQERYKALTSAKALGAILVYDVTRRQTFESLRRWVDELRFQAGDDVKILLAGNKVDLVYNNPKERQVTAEEGDRLAREYGMMFLETSAKADANVTESFEELLRSIYHDVGDRLVREQQAAKKLHAEQPKPEQGGCKC